MEGIYITPSFILMILAIAGIVCLFALAKVLFKLHGILSRIDDIVSSNSAHINATMKSVPSVVSNVEEVTENVKGVSLVATDIAADAILAKDAIKNNALTVIRIFTLLRALVK